MSYQNILSPQQRSIRLFGIETAGINSFLWKNPRYFSNNHVTSFNRWKSTKRDFTAEEVLSQRWLYLIYRGSPSILSFHRNNTIIGEDLFFSKQFQGSWKIIQADVGWILEIIFQYQFVEIIANRLNSFHSGIVLFRPQGISSYIRFFPS